MPVGSPPSGATSEVVMVHDEGQDDTKGYQERRQHKTRSINNGDVLWHYRAEYTEMRRGSSGKNGASSEDRPINQPPREGRATFFAWYMPKSSGTERGVCSVTLMEASGLQQGPYPTTCGSWGNCRPLLHRTSTPAFPAMRTNRWSSTIGDAGVDRIGSQNNHRQNMRVHESERGC